MINTDKFTERGMKMKKKIYRIVSLILVAVLMVTAFAGCGTQVEKPQVATVKTDLQDAKFVLTYGDLRKVLPGDKLATLFENTKKKTDDKTVELSYYELVSTFGGEAYFDDLLAIIPAEQMAKLTANQQQVLDYFNNLINGIKENGSARVSYNESFWIDHNDEVIFKSADGKELENQDVFRAAFRLYADTALQDIGSFLMNKGQDEATNYGDDLTSVMYPLGEKYASSLTLDDLYTDKETKTYPVYSSVIPMLVNDIDENGDNAEDERGEYIFVPTELNRTICITVKPEEESVKKAFSIREKDGIIKQFKTAESYMTLNSFEIAFKPCKITAGINAVNDEMTYVTYDKNMVITANVTFTGALAQYGNVIVEFPCTSQLTYNFGWKEAAE